MNLVEFLNTKNMKAKVADYRVGDTVRVHQKIVEGSKERTQIFEGVVIKTSSGKNINGTLTVRKISDGVGVERTYLVHSPRLVKIEVVRRANVRRANISYLRNLRGKKAKLKEKGFDSLAVNVQDADNANVDADIADEKSVEISDPDESVSISGEENELDAEITEISAADEEDEEKLKEISTEKLAEEEEKESEKVHEVEEENTPEDESNLPESETEEGIERVDDEDTKGQK